MYNSLKFRKNRFNVKGLRFVKKGLRLGENGFDVKGLANDQKGFEAYITRSGSLSHILG